MATHSSILAWEIPWREEPGRLQSIELQRVEQDLVTRQQQQCILLPRADVNNLQPARRFFVLHKAHKLLHFRPNTGHIL